MYSNSFCRYDRLRELPECTSEFSVLIPEQAITCREGKYVLADVAKFEVINYLPGMDPVVGGLPDLFKKTHK